jgi:hypothetical protein
MGAVILYKGQPLHSSLPQEAILQAPLIRMYK